MPAVTVKRIFEVALKIEEIPGNFKSKDDRDKWFIENLGATTFKELDAARLLHSIAENICEDVNNRR